MNETMLFEKTYACLAGAAVGDCLGAPSEGWYYKAVLERWGPITGIVHDHKLYKGREASTDDTQHLRIIAGTILEKGGRIDAYDLASGIRKFMNLSMMADTEHEMYKKITLGMNPHTVGLGQFTTPSPSFASPPIGIVNACDPRTAARDAYEIYTVWVDSYAQEAPMAVVAAVAEAFKPTATRDSIVDAAMAYCGPRVRERIERAVEVASGFDDPWEAVPTFYEKLLVPDGLEEYIEQLDKYRHRYVSGRTLEQSSYSASPLEMVPMALAFFYIGNGDAMKAMGGAATFGRDCDGIASMAGAITGAWKGLDALDLEVVEKVDTADMAFYSEHDYDGIKVLAEKMQTPMLNTFKEKELVVQSLEGLT